MSLGGLVEDRRDYNQRAISNFKRAYNAAFNVAKQQGSTIIVASGNNGINFQGKKMTTFVSWQIFKPSFPLMHVDQSTGIHQLTGIRRP
jgi:hypothetical protein